MESIYPVFEDIASRSANKVSVIYLGKTYSYAQLREYVERMALALFSLGIGQGDRAIMFLPNLPQWIIAWLALQKIGAVAIPITPFYAPVDLQYIANDSGAETIFCLDTNFGYVTRILSDTRIKRVVVTTMVQVLPLWKRMLAKALNKVPEGRFQLGGGTFSFDHLLKGRVRESQAGKVSGADREQSGSGASNVETAEILYTGGTTGHPKGVPISHALFLESMREQRNWRARHVPDDPGT